MRELVRSVLNQSKACLHLAFYQMKTTPTMLPVQTQKPKAAKAISERDECH